MGRLIAIDGLDGSGKHTQFSLIADALEARGVRVKRLDFPVYDSEGSALVRLYLGGGLGSSPDDTNAYAASIFFAADCPIEDSVISKKVFSALTSGSCVLTSSFPT